MSQLMDEIFKEGFEQLYHDYLVDHGDVEFEADAANLSGYRRQRVIEIVKELRNRRAESLSMYKPLPHLAPFHASNCIERVIRGSNRSGKTLAAAIECARIVTGQDPYNKLPARDGRCIIVGKDGRHNSEVIYRKLFRFGAFKVLERTPGSGQWVAFNPKDRNHHAMEKYAKPAPPLIPERFIQDIAWENKKESSPRKIILKNGWEITFFTSLGKPPNGLDVDYAWFDEEIADAEWYPEIAARLIDRSGLFCWSATAQLGGRQFYELCERSSEEKADGVPDKKRKIIEYFAHIDDNTHFSEKQREAFFHKLTEEQRRIRIEGEFAFTERLVYPEFSERVHGCDFFEIPPTWTRWLVVDPGRQVCAVLFVAVPPPSHKLADHVFFYDELYIRSCDAAKFAEAVRQKTHGQTFYEFLIDHQYGRIHDPGGGKNLEMQYSQALRNAGVRSRATGSGFNPASNDVPSGIEAFRSWLVTRGDGTQKLRYFRDKMPHFKHEAQRYAYIKTKELKEKPEKKDDHLMDCARYIAMRDPRWVKPSRRVPTPRGLLRKIAEKRAKIAEMAGGVRLGPGATV